jgi:hypothetical protein
MKTQRTTFAIVAGLTVGALLALVYSYAAVYMPIVNPAVTDISFFQDHPIISTTLVVVTVRALPLALLMFALAAVASRLLKSSTLRFATFVVTGWLLATFVLMPAFDGNFLGFITWMARVWFAVVPTVLITIAALFLSVLRYGYDRSGR